MRILALMNSDHQSRSTQPNIGGDTEAVEEPTM
jgi:hypothetical protein